MPPPIAVIAAMTTTPKRSSPLLRAASTPLTANTATPPRSKVWSIIGRPAMLAARHGLEERIAKRPVRFRGPVEIPYSLLPRRFVDESGGQRALANPFDHGGERVPGESLDKLRPARVDVDHPRRHRHVPETRLEQERIQPAPDQRVAARPGLQLDETPYGLPGMRALRVEIRRAMIALDDGDGAAGLEDLAETLEEPREAAAGAPGRSRRTRDRRRPARTAWSTRRPAETSRSRIRRIGSSPGRQPGTPRICPSRRTSPLGSAPPA